MYSASFVDVFYATDRQSLPAAGEYGPRPNSDGLLKLGRIRVSIPADHVEAHIELPGWFRSNKPEHIFYVKDRHVRAVDDFYRELSGAVNTSAEKAALVFVHGYNVAFDDAIFRAAQLKVDLHFQGPVTAYSWPSRNSVLGYFYDRTNAEWSSAHFRTFLEQFAARSGATTIHVIAHSMGGSVVANALRTDFPSTKLQEVILAAPDIDARMFGQLADSLKRSTKRVTLYASSKDRALQWSRWFNGERRAGDSNPVDAVEGIDYIDASNLDEDLLGHSYFADVRSILEDISYLIRLGLPPSDRAGLRRAPSQTYWYFPR